MRTGAVPRKHTRARAAALGAVAALVLFITTLVVPLAPPPAQATIPGIDPNTLSWDTANRSYYGHYNTPIFTSTNTDGQTTFSYCVDPTTIVPKAGTYQTMPVQDFNPGMARETRAAMWFGYGGPGFDPSMWPSAWSDGSPMQASNYYAATHIILSYTTMQDLRYTYYNAGSDFIGYAANTFVGYNLYGRVVNGNSTMFQMFARADEVPDDYVCYYLDCGEKDWIQYVIAQDPYTPLGDLAVLKASSNPTLTSGNPCYTLEGAVFGVYADAGCEQLETTLVTDASGAATTQGLRAAAHWVKELAAPPGYTLNGAAHAVQVPTGGTATVEVADVPQADPLPLVVRKVDATVPDRGLEGAEFTLCYYAGAYDAAGLPSTPTRSWVLRTDGGGEARLGDGWLVSGDEFYRDGEGTPVLPLGTVSIQETKAPNGYLIDDPTMHVQRIEAGSTPGVSFYAAPTMQDTPALGGLSIQKTDANTGLAAPQGGASFKNAEFSIIALNPMTLDGTAYEVGDTVATLITDASGFASTSASALPCGSYRVEESKAPAGYLISPKAWAVDIEVPDVIVAVGDTPQHVSDEGAVVAAPSETGTGTAPLVPDIPQVAASGFLSSLSRAFGPLFVGPTAAYAQEAGSPVIPEQVIRGGIRVQKIDAELEGAQAQGGASLAGARFSIVNSSQGDVVVNGKVFAPGEEVTVITTGDDGIAQTGEHDLPFGSYSVTEVGAPAGYRLSDPETRTVEVRDDGRLCDAPTSFADLVLRGGITLEKLDADTARPEPQGAASLAGAEFEISNASDGPVVVGGQTYAPGETVMTIVTDENGRASTGEHDLPYGLYSVFEATAPAGYVASEGAQIVCVAQEGERVALSSPIRERVQRGGFGLRKLDGDTGQAEPQGSAHLAGTVYRIVNANDRPVVVGGVEYPPGETVMAVETDETGWAQTGGHDLPFGTYAAVEVEAPEGYRLGLVDESGEETGEGASLTVTIDGEWSWKSYERDVRDHVVRGGLALVKVDADLAEGAQGQATLAGAQFVVENASEHAVVVDGTSFNPGETVATLTTDESGRASTGPRDLPYGTYLVRETQASNGYLVNETVWETHIQHDGDFTLVGGAADGAGAAQPVGFFESIAAFLSPTPADAQEAAEEAPPSGEPVIPEQVIRGGVEIFKRDSENTDGTAQGDTSLAGTRFAVISLNDNGTLVGGTVYQKGETVMVLETDEQGRAASGNRDLPFGTYAVKEIKPPAGYLAPTAPTTQILTIADDGVLASIDNPFVNSPARGGLSLRKVDAETSGDAPLGSARLDGATFSISNASRHAVVVDGESFEPGEVIMHIETDIDGRASTGKRELPIGTYALTEVRAPEGYVPDTEKTLYVSVLEDGAVFECTETLPNRVIRGDVEGIKVEDGTQRRMAGVAFLVTSLTTGEHHVIVSDENGLLATGAQTAPHTHGTNGNDAAVDADGRVIDEKILSASNGLWFSGSSALATEPNDGVGALPFDRYRFDELPTTANYGHDLVSFEVSVRRDGEVVNLGTVSNDMICLKTTAYIGTPGQNETAAEGSVVVTDVVSYANLTVGTPYELRGTLVKRATGEPLLDDGGNELTSTRQFVPGERSGAAEVAFEIDAGALEGEQVVVFERLYQDGVEIAAHEDVADDAQTVSFAGISTVAAGAVSGLHEEQARPRTTIVDTVSYRGLTAGREYRLEGTVVDAATGIPLDGPDGSPVTAAHQFVATGRSGIERIAFEFDATGLAGHSVVVFERLYQGNHAIATHCDLTSQEQTVRLVSLKTTAVDKASGSHIGDAAPETTVVDTVAFQGLEAGAHYQLVGVLMDQSSRTPLLDKDGREIVVTRALVPLEPDGSAVMEFNLDSCPLFGPVVVFELLLRGDAVVASHADIDDEAQTVCWNPASPIPHSGDSAAQEMSLLMAAGGAGCLLTASAVAFCTLRRRANRTPLP